MRVVAESVAAPPTVLKTREEFYAILKQRAQERKDAQDADVAQKSAMAMRDAGQGIQSLASVQGGAQAAPGAAPLGQAA